MRIVLAVFGLMALSACEAEEPERSPFADLKANWLDLPDGSKFAQVRAEDFTADIGAMRCWPTDGEKFECLAVSDSSKSLSMTSVEARTYDELPELIFPAGDAVSGYSCYSFMGFQEQVKRRGQKLIGNKVDYGSPRWSRKYVQSYMTDNNVDGQPYYKCLEILDAVTKGSVATLGTTSITRNLLE